MHKVIITSVCTFILAAASYADENADNTGRNAKDRTDKTVTSGDQSETKEDIAITAAIRNAIVKDDGLSMMAKNVKIVTINGDVTLRGPVNSDEEKKKVEEHAKAGGAKTVTNSLEVKTQI